MSGFSRHRRSGRIFATFSGLEADLLRSLASQLVELLRNEGGDPARQQRPPRGDAELRRADHQPDDPVLARLFPTAYLEDDEAAGEFRRFTEGALRDSKAAGAAAVIDALEEAGLPAEPMHDQKLVIDVELDPGDGVMWLKTFTDLRLRWPPGSRSSRTTTTTGSRCPTTTHAPGPRHLPVVGASRRRSSTPCADVALVSRRR